MKYFFILGNHPELSVTEIYSVLGESASYLALVNGALIVEIKSLDAESLIKRLGGTIKIGEIEGEIKDLAGEIGGALSMLLQKNTKPFFGISLYGGKYNFLPTALTIKKEITIAERAPRFVTSKESVLSSVVVEQNKLTNGGLEMVLIMDSTSSPQEKKYWYGRTLAVQDFKELSKRDYGRPARDDASGMLPPKLAQILINLTGADFDETLLDPFCGSGTVIGEAALMGFQNLIGTDLSAVAVNDSWKNFDYLEKSYELRVTSCEFKISNATKISDILNSNQVDAIATEPYLGPQRGERNFVIIKKELDVLYSEALSEFKKVVKTGGRVVMVWPVFSRNTHHVSRSMVGLVEVAPNFQGWEMVDAWPEGIRNDAKGYYLYGRPGQSVWRRIVILQKK